MLFKQLFCLENLLSATFLANQQYINCWYFPRLCLYLYFIQPNIHCMHTFFSLNMWLLLLQDNWRQIEVRWMNRRVKRSCIKCKHSFSVCLHVQLIWAIANALPTVYCPHPNIPMKERNSLKCQQQLAMWPLRDCKARNILAVILGHVMCISVNILTYMVCVVLNGTTWGADMKKREKTNSIPYTPPSWTQYLPVAHFRSTVAIKEIVVPPWLLQAPLKLSISHHWLFFTTARISHPGSSNAK